MILTFIFIVIAGSVAVITYPLFCSKLKSYQLPEVDSEDFSQANSWLSALSDLEDDHSLGRISNPDYQRQKIFFQRNYLKCRQQSSNS